MTINYQFGDVD
ncbi:ESAT-6 like protein EsxL, partial [Mycobacterium tuberculosis TKK_03_0018]